MILDPFVTFGLGILLGVALDRLLLRLAVPYIVRPMRRHER